MKGWLKVLAGVLVVLVVLLVALAVFAGHIVKSAVNTAGPKALGVPVSLRNVSVNLLSGHFGLDELVVGNPDGFKTPDAIRVHKMAVDVKMASLFSPVLVIDRIYVGGPEINLEVGRQGSNIGAIHDKMASSTPATKQPAPAAKPAKEAGASKETKKVRINDFLVENGKINFSAMGISGSSATIPLPAIRLVDIGKESDGATLQEVIAKLFGAIGGAVNSAVAGGIGGSIPAIGKDAVDAGKVLGKGAVEAGKTAGETAVGAGKNLGKGAVESGKSVGKDAGKAIEGLGGLFK